MHWFLVEQSSINLKNIVNICVYKLSFCYFYHDEIYLLQEIFHLEVYIKLKMIVEMENYKFEVKRVTRPKAITPCYFVIQYISWNSVNSLV